MWGGWPAVKLTRSHAQIEVGRPFQPDGHELDGNSAWMMVPPGS
jgi:hypothetical protein